MKNNGSVFKDKTLEYGIDDSGCRGIVVGDVDNNGYPDILKWRLMTEISPHHDLEEYDYTSTRRYTSQDSEGIEGGGGEHGEHNAPIFLSVHPFRRRFVLNYVVTLEKSGEPVEHGEQV